MALFVSPAGWVVAALFVLLTSAFGFVVPVLAGQAATMDGVFAVITGFLLPVLIPVLTMRSFAEERSDGTLELLLTSPVRDIEIILGKFVAALFMYACMIQGLVHAQVRAVSNFVEKRNRDAWKIADAVRSLGHTASSMLDHA